MVKGRRAPSAMRRRDCRDIEVIIVV